MVSIFVSQLVSSLPYRCGSCGGHTRLISTAWSECSTTGSTGYLLACHHQRLTSRWMIDPSACLPQQRTSSSGSGILCFFS